MRIDEGLNRGVQLRDTAKDAAADLLGRQQRELTFDETQPRGVRGGEVHVESWTLRKPVANEWRFMGAVVVHDDVDVEGARHLCVDQIEELAKLRRAVPLMKLRDHFTRLRVERGEQRRAVPCVVVRPPFHLTGRHRQQGCVRSSA